MNDTDLIAEFIDRVFSDKDIGRLPRPWECLSPGLDRLLEEATHCIELSERTVLNRHTEFYNGVARQQMHWRRRPSKLNQDQVSVISLFEGEVIALSGGCGYGLRRPARPGATCSSHLPR